MRTFLGLCSVVVLSLALVVPAPAGIISTGGTEPTPTPTPQDATSASSTNSSAAQDGTMYPGVAGSESGAGTVAQIALSLLQSASSLF